MQDCYTVCSILAQSHGHGYVTSTTGKHLPHFTHNIQEFYLHPPPHTHTHTPHPTHTPVSQMQVKIELRWVKDTLADKLNGLCIQEFYLHPPPPPPPPPPHTHTHTHTHTPHPTHTPVSQMQVKIELRWVKDTLADKLNGLCIYSGGHTGY